MTQIKSVRILSFNIHKGVAWGLRRPTHEKIHQSLCELHPDLIFLQEIRGLHFDNLSCSIWPHFSYGKNAVYQKGHHGNAILSKYPISFSENIDISMHRYERRGLLHSITQLSAQSGPLHLLCVHLSLFKKDRKKQMEKILQFIKTELPENEPLILGGDFNDWSGQANEPFLRDLGFQEAFLNSQGVYARTYPSWAPMLRLDRIYMRGFNVSSAQRLMQSPWRNLSDHIAIEADLEPLFLCDTNDE